MLLSDSEDESEQLQSDSQSDSESSLCSPDEDYIPKGLGRGSDEWVAELQTPWAGFVPAARKRA